ncbi:pyruvate, phosphate dikinase [Rickettsiales bacterium]|nr:pyruvate, phosphate dikinase [Rickettsiales bacterium]
MTKNKFVYNFGDGKSEGDASMKNLLGGKGANLAEMSNLELPVPPGFTVTTEVCDAYYKNDRNFPKELQSQINESIAKIEQKLGTNFGDSDNPLLFSVRSGARASMPGMMDTVLNLGLNDQTLIGLANKSNNKRFALDSYRRFIQMYSDVVLGVDHYNFEAILDEKKSEYGVFLDTDLTEDHLEEIISLFKAKVAEETGKEFPQNVNEQLWGGIEAVFASWMNDRAITYRELNDIPVEWGTAVNIQSMVFGNMGETCATGVAFTRDPSTGAKEFYGEYLINAQGEDVVAGIRTPQNITKAARIKSGSDLPSMEESMPAAYQDLVDIYKKLELHYRDMQDIEFTIQNNKLWMLQTRSGKRSVTAALKIAVDMVSEGLINKNEAVKRISPESLDQLLHPRIDDKADVDILTKALPASPGAASGVVVFSSKDAEEKSKAGNVILVRAETSPEDIKGMAVAKAILTSRGGMTSHAAVVARGMGTPCVCGASEVEINYDAKEIIIGQTKIKEGEIITINGSTGDVILGTVPTIDPELSEDFKIVMSWVDEIRRLKIRTNAETAKDCKIALEFGAEGIGLCRTEHMFFNEDRVDSVRQMILSDTKEGRLESIEKLLPMQRQDFEEIFEIMDGLPVNIRLLDPPLHEFLPHEDKDIIKMADILNVSKDYIKSRIIRLSEENPMLGHRGCRLGISYPEIYQMQARAIFEAAFNAKKKGQTPVIEIMVPLVCIPKELEILKKVINDTYNEVKSNYNGDLNYMVGTMIELPRAALVADEIAREAEFFSFGTNDLTQTTLGISRDDAGNFLPDYKSQNIIEKDPFAVLDQRGVGQLIKIAVNNGRSTRNNIKLGICGEHGGDPKSVNFCHKIGLDYVSCSPYRVPIARIAAAQASLEDLE